MNLVKGSPNGQSYVKVQSMLRQDEVWQLILLEQTLYLLPSKSHAIDGLEIIQVLAYHRNMVKLSYVQRLAAKLKRFSYFTE